MLDLERINTSTRRTVSGDNFPEVSVGVCAWQPRAASVRAKIRVRNGFTTVGTIPRLSHAAAICKAADTLRTSFGPTQNRLAALRRLPAVPIFNNVKLNRSAVSLRTDPRSYLRTSTLNP